MITVNISLLSKEDGRMDIQNQKKEKRKKLVLVDKINCIPDIHLLWQVLRPTAYTRAWPTWFSCHVGPARSGTPESSSSPPRSSYHLSSPPPYPSPLSSNSHVASHDWSVADSNCSFDREGRRRTTPDRLIGAGRVREDPMAPAGRDWRTRLRRSVTDGLGSCVWGSRWWVLHLSGGIGSLVQGLMKQP